MERTIRVTGKGKLAVKPDLIELTLSIKDIKKEYDELLKRSSSATNEVKELLEKIGFERKNIKTKSFYMIVIEIKMINGLKNLKAIALFIK